MEKCWKEDRNIFFLKIVLTWLGLEWTRTVLLLHLPVKISIAMGIKPWTAIPWAWLLHCSSCSSQGDESLAINLGWRLAPNVQSILQGTRRSEQYPVHSGSRSLPSSCCSRLFWDCFWIMAQAGCLCIALAQWGDCSHTYSSFIFH